MKRFKIFNTNIHNYKKEEFNRIIKRIIKKKDNSFNLPVCIATVNPEILLKARKSIDYRKILNSFEYTLTDGFGIVGCLFLKGKRVFRYPGADLATFLLTKSLKCNLKTTFVIDKKGLTSVNDLTLFVENEFGKRSLNCCNFLLYDKFSSVNPKIAKNTEILLVAIGAPWQEKFIQSTKKTLPKLKIAIGIGGTFDYWTNNQKRPPKIISFLGLEWAWRILLVKNYTRKKQRVKRILKSVFVFPIKYFFDNSK